MQKSPNNYNDNNKVNKFILAPLRGITDFTFRNLYEKHFGKFDALLAPFVSTLKGSRVGNHHVRDVLPENNLDFENRLIPQIIGKEAEGFLLLCRKFDDLGFDCVNWNLGCPAPLITKKLRGCGLLPHADIIKKFLDDVVPKMPSKLKLSIKVRLGLNRNDDLEKVLENVINDYPISEIIIHPRIGIQMYDGVVDLDKFETCLKISKHPVVYNGDIKTVDDFVYLTNRFPSVISWMIGRGVVANPNLLPMLRGEEPRPVKPFMDELFETSLNKSPPINALGRMKEIWRYLGKNLCDDDTLEKILQAQDVEQYNNIVGDVLKGCD